MTPINALSRGCNLGIDLIVGGKGFIGQSLKAHQRALGRNVVLTSRKPAGSDELFLDLEDPSSFQVPEGVRYAVICSGISGKAVERDSALSQRVNVIGMKVLLAKLISMDVKIIYLSSSSVFSCEQNLADETWVPQPRTLYGHQKLEVENFLQVNTSNYAVIRPTKVLGLNSSLFESWNSLRERKRPLKINAQARIAPISISRLIHLIHELESTNLNGIFHLSGKQSIGLEQLAMEYGNQSGKLGSYSVDIYSLPTELPNSSWILSSTRANECREVQPQSLQSFWSDFHFT